MAVQLGPRELALRALRESGGGGVARQFEPIVPLREKRNRELGLPIRKLGPPKANKPMWEKAAKAARPLNAEEVEQRARLEGPDLRVDPGADALRQIRTLRDMLDRERLGRVELEDEVQRLKRELAGRDASRDTAPVTCPKCEAVRLAAAARKRKERERARAK